jgi:molecular chaperone GrpE
MSDSDVKEDPAGFEDVEPELPAIDPKEFEALKARAEGAERKLREIQGTYTAAKAELDATRARLERDVERKVDIRFADLLSNLLECADDLDRALEHGRSIKAAAPVVQGVTLARDRFLSALAKAGLERIEPLGLPYDPNVAEAVGVLPVSDASEHDTVVRLERVGYRLSGRVIRPARVLVGQLVS